MLRILFSYYFISFNSNVLLLWDLWILLDFIRVVVTAQEKIHCLTRRYQEIYDMLEEIRISGNIWYAWTLAGVIDIQFFMTIYYMVQYTGWKFSSTFITTYLHVLFSQHTIGIKFLKVRPTVLVIDLDHCFSVKSKLEIYILI